MTREELVEFANDLFALQEKIRNHRPDMLGRFGGAEVIVIPSGWTVAKEGAVTEVFNLKVVRADVEKPGVLV